VKNVYKVFTKTLTINVLFVISTVQNVLQKTLANNVYKAETLKPLAKHVYQVFIRPKKKILFVENVYQIAIFVMKNKDKIVKDFANIIFN
jgi:ABC-type uncharacterized transport system permease subunit